MISGVQFPAPPPSKDINSSTIDNVNRFVILKPSDNPDFVLCWNRAKVLHFAGLLFFIYLLPMAFFILFTRTTWAWRISTNIFINTRLRSRPARR